MSDLECCPKKVLGKSSFWILFFAVVVSLACSVIIGFGLLLYVVTDPPPKGTIGKYFFADMTRISMAGISLVRVEIMLI